MTSPRASFLRELVSARRDLQHLASQGERHDTWFDGARTRWRRWGDGPDLVLIHGGHGSWMHWARNIDGLASRFQLWLPDMPGFGESDALPGHPHDPNRQQRLIGSLAAGLSQLPMSGAGIGIAGFSFGGLVAAQLATTTATHVQRLALLGTAGHGGQRRQADELMNWRQTRGLERWQAHALNLQRLMLHDSASIDAQALLAHACSSHATRYRSKAISRDARLPDILATYRDDLLLVWGEHDVTALPSEIGRVLLDGRDHRHLHIVPDAGHWVQYEQSDLCNGILTAWFGDKTPPAS
ncbi:MAG: alpha/beta fold hydrolase [Hydrogenophaga sp.]|jgi:2-hydroxy-6-oxonona-2,4-dienedioate hydrolase|uniref:alpha/beta fold hydrolase n=1 Tax=Hydrogenophaga sp. TaxID=1904254 RepID=UPI00273575AA|nr:alpha/beta fold hydrolase [Hydrogenophaga sp.]MDP3626457.1 alpha/beta fold hydrolase [Hydrogenophaga sp.]